MRWDVKRVLAVGALCAALTQIGRLWEPLRYLGNAFPTAYAAEKKAVAAQSQLDQYLASQREAFIRQEAYQKAQHEFAEQLMQQRTLKDDREQTEDDPMPVEVWEDPDDPDLWQYEDEEGRWCSDGRLSWRWHPTRHCHRR